MTFIELHCYGNPRLIVINRISVLGSDSQGTFILLDGGSKYLYVDESYDEVKNELQEVGFIWNE